MAAVSSHEFAQWREYWMWEPFGADVDHSMIATLTALTANLGRDPKKRRAYDPDVFMPGRRAQAADPAAAAQAQRTMFDAFFVGLGGKLPIQ